MSTDFAFASPGSGGLGITAVERDTGLSKDLLRVWERRYGFPRPQRDAHGERLYGPAEVDKLRLIRRLMERGLRPGKIVHRAPGDLLEMLHAGDPAVADAQAPVAPELQAFMALLKLHGVDPLRRALSQAVLRVGLARFVMDVVHPLNRLVGEAWMRGELEIFEEHLYAESLQVVLRGAISSLPRDGTPRILLTTLPGEAHGLGLLMAEALLALEGAHCVSLGVQTPARDVVLAAAAQRAQVVALSFSGSYPANLLAENLGDLRARLPAEIELWVGGAAVATARRLPENVRVIAGLAGISAALSDFREKSID